MESLPKELMLQVLLKMKHSDIQNLCKTNSNYRNFCNQNEEDLYKKLIERDTLCVDASSYKELYMYMLHPKTTKLELCKKRYCEKSLAGMIKIIKFYVNTMIEQSNNIQLFMELLDIVTSCKTEIIPKILIKSFIQKIEKTSMEFDEEWNSKRDKWLEKLKKHL